MTRTHNAPPPPGIGWGAKPETQPAACRAFADDFQTIPRNQWRTRRLRHYVRHVFGQIDGMCTSNGAAGLLMALREAAGLELKILAPPTLYEQHSRWGTGSSLAENIDALCTVGICDADFAGGEQTRLGNVPKNWKTNAARYRLDPDEVWNLQGEFDKVATAIQRGFPCLIGLDWPGGHSVLATDFIRDPDGSCHLEGPNSWGATWNGDGFWHKTEPACRSMPRFGAYAARAPIHS